MDRVYSVTNEKIKRTVNQKHQKDPGDLTEHLNKNK
jgi:hypothetical protein